MGLNFSTYLLSSLFTFYTQGFLSLFTYKEVQKYERLPGETLKCALLRPHTGTILYGGWLSILPLSVATEHTVGSKWLRKRFLAKRGPYTRKQYNFPKNAQFKVAALEPGMIRLPVRNLF